MAENENEKSLSNLFFTNATNENIYDI